DVPSIVPAAREVGSLGVDLLARALADVADVEVAGRAVEREAERVAEALGPHLGLPGRRLVGEVEAQHLAERRAVVLGAVLGIAARAAVAEAEMEPAVADRDRAAVVVGIGLVEPEEDRLAVG